MCAVPKNNGRTFVLRETDILTEQMNKDEWRLSDLTQIGAKPGESRCLSSAPELQKYVVIWDRYH